MNKIYYSRIGINGFTNQIFSLITSIINAYNSNKNIVIVNNFKNDLTKNKYTPISEIFNLNLINQFLKHKYNLVILDRNNIHFKINYVKYGINNNLTDITDYIINNCYRENMLHINTALNLNSINGDPCHGIQKKVYISYSINGIVNEEEFTECNNFLTENIIFNTIDRNFIHTFGWINSIDRNMFEDILKNIHYNNNFIQIVIIF